MVYTYDDLHRHFEGVRGVDGGSAAIGSQQYTYNLLGNWNKWEKDLTGDGDYGDSNELENRTHNLANELTGRDTNGSGGNEITFTLDDAGNVRTSNDGVATTTCTHDGWNRLVVIVPPYSSAGEWSARRGTGGQNARLISPAPDPIGSPHPLRALLRSTGSAEVWAQKPF